MPDTASSSRQESPAWESIHGEWRPLHGGIFSEGFSLEWHDFHLSDSLDWSRSFHEKTLEICLNFSGDAAFGSGRSGRRLEAGQIAVYNTPDAPVDARRETDSAHRFCTLELTAGFLGSQLSGALGQLKPGIRKFIETGGESAGSVECQPLPPSLLPLRMGLLTPPVFPSAHTVWYQGKILEVLAATVFQRNQTTELFCHQHKRINRERVEQARFLLERDLENPPDLTMLAAELGCSAFHLSRIFARECGVSIPKYLRMQRIEKAAEMLRGCSNVSVTDAATAVGYSSLSAFIKAFVEHFGVLPSRYLSKK